jgi:hypothetical protein
MHAEGVRAEHKDAYPKAGQSYKLVSISRYGFLVVVEMCVGTNTVVILYLSTPGTY